MFHILGWKFLAICIHSSNCFWMNSPGSRSEFRTKDAWENGGAGLGLFPGGLRFPLQSIQYESCSSVSWCSIFFEVTSCSFCFLSFWQLFDAFTAKNIQKSYWLLPMPRNFPPTGQWSWRRRASWKTGEIHRLNRSSHMENFTKKNIFNRKIYTTSGQTVLNVGSQMSKDLQPQFSYPRKSRNIAYCPWISHFYPVLCIFSSKK